MLILAAVLDLLGLFCLFLSVTLGIGIPLSFVPDLIGFLFIGGWMYIVRGTGVGLTQQATRRLGIASLVEIIPGLGDISTSWVLLVLITIFKSD